MMEQTMMEMMMAPNTSTWMKPTEETTMTNSLVETTVELTVERKVEGEGRWLRREARGWFGEAEEGGEGIRASPEGGGAVGEWVRDKGGFGHLFLLSFTCASWGSAWAGTRACRWARGDKAGGLGLVGSQGRERGRGRLG